MWFSVSEQFKVIIFSLFMGIFLGILYDCIRLTRIVSGVGSYSRLASALYKKKLPLIRGKRALISPKQGSGAYQGVLLLLGDILYALLCAAAYSLFLFHTVRGQARWYFILASAVGFFIYYFTVSKIVLTVLEVILFGLKAAFRYITELIILPVRLVVRLVSKAAGIVNAGIILPAADSMRYSRAVKYTEKMRRALKCELRFSDD